MKYLSIAGAKQAFLDKKISPSELSGVYLSRIRENTSNAYITVCEDAGAKAQECDTSKPLGGIPLAIKDVFCTKGIKSTAASKMLMDFVPPYESTVTERLLQNGSVHLGKANMDEFAMGSSNKHSAFGPVVSPWKKTNSNVQLIPGGSSGGSAAAVSSDLCIAATGSDTGGSVRQPAAFCGIVGFKPSYGRCSRYGMIAYSSSFDQAGFLTKTVEDSAILYSLTAGRDGKDSTLSGKVVEQLNSLKTTDVNGLRVGVPKEFQSDNIHPDIAKNWQETLAKLEKSGAKIVEISLPNVKYSIQVYYFISTAEASSNLARYDGIKYGYSRNVDGETLDQMIARNRFEGFGEEVKRRILIGTSMILKDSYETNFKSILRLRALIAHEYKEAFKKCDALVYPTTPNLALEFGESQTAIQEYLNDLLTVPANIVGLPAISVPTTLSSDGRPIGIQIVANAFHESELFKTAFALENSWKFNEQFGAQIAKNIG